MEVRIREGGFKLQDMIKARCLKETASCPGHQTVLRNDGESLCLARSTPWQSFTTCQRQVTALRDLGSLVQSTELWECSFLSQSPYPPLISLWILSTDSEPNTADNTSRKTLSLPLWIYGGRTKKQLNKSI